MVGVVVGVVVVVVVVWCDAVWREQNPEGLGVVV
jgi:hypothetical protein